MIRAAVIVRMVVVAAVRPERAALKMRLDLHRILGVAVLQIERSGHRFRCRCRDTQDAGALVLAGARQADFLRRPRSAHYGLRAVLGVADVEWLLCFLLRNALALRVGLRAFLRFLLESRFHRRALLRSE